ncbi:MAG: hypothetical protein WC358_11840 [Ignavibacteria bacterium]|jgi:hypothetical protein
MDTLKQIIKLCKKSGLEYKLVSTEIDLIETFKKTKPKGSIIRLKHEDYILVKLTDLGIRIILNHIKFKWGHDKTKYEKFPKSIEEFRKHLVDKEGYTKQSLSDFLFALAEAHKEMSLIPYTYFLNNYYTDIILLKTDA